MSLLRMSLLLLSLLAALLAIARGCRYDFTQTSFTDYSDTRDLILYNCNFTHIPQNFLNFMPSVKMVYIKKNPIQELSTNALRGLDFTKLIMKDNLVPLKLASRALANMTLLRVVKLINCSITSLPGDLLHGSDAVEDIDLSKNQINHLPADIFANKSSLKTLTLSQNKLRDVSPATFAPLHNLWRLDLDHNEFFAINPGTFSSMNKLMKLWIRHNKLRVIAPDAFPVSLRHLGLGSNELTTLETQFLPGLTEISLNDNSLSRVPQNWPATLPALEFIYLFGNAFTLLTESDMAVLSHYATTSVEHNNIETILVDQNTTKIPELWLAGAPLRCDCWMHRFATLLHNDTDKVKDAYCAYPASLNGARLTDVPLIDFVCHLDTCPDTCTCVVKPATKALEMECRKQLTIEQLTWLENLRQKNYKNITETMSFI